jgi:hypothetical protein
MEMIIVCVYVTGRCEEDVERGEYHPTPIYYYSCRRALHNDGERGTAQFRPSVVRRVLMMSQEPTKDTHLGINQVSPTPPNWGGMVWYHSIFVVVGTFGLR